MTKYDSEFERSLHSGPLKDFIYHPITRKIVIDEDYTPDYGFEINGFMYYVEAKGYLYSSHRAKIYKAFRDSLQNNEELVFCFQDPNVEIKWMNKRKDGTKMTLCQWADNNKFRWYIYDTMFVLLYEIKNKKD